MCFTEAKPNCTHYTEQQNRVCLCIGDNSDYVLRRGLVSDNNRTTSIILKDCSITKVEQESFEHLPTLKSIDLSYNKIRTLKLGVLDGTRAVTHINLSNNRLTTLPLGLFDQKKDLLELDLSSNEIDTLKLGIFDPLTKLKHVNLANNSLTGDNVNPYIFDKSKGIQRLNFSKNDMRNAEDILLHAFRALEVLDLNECQLEDVPDFVSLRTNLNTLKRLYLSSNSIKELSNHLKFIHLSNLEILDLSLNLIETIGGDIFNMIRKLKVVVLRDNRLKIIPETLFYGKASLSNIDLSHNLIEYVPVNALRGTRVKNLNLANNKFSYLQDNFCLEIRNSGGLLTKFYFNQNPWQCDCLLQVVNEVKRMGIEYNSAMYDGKHPVCVVTDQKGCQRQASFNEADVAL
ncbi:unnamed protein product [Leptidea sinapis]|uniref:LRRCT domain-containing protein n=1 Tax=Leptidea sinapis TaxID=189913 RepID=A0A5E4PR67_9NEOP|nr:unnamed protein product [Leptidea sinapis]